MWNELSPRRKEQIKTAFSKYLDKAKTRETTAPKGKKTCRNGHSYNEFGYFWLGKRICRKCSTDRERNQRHKTAKAAGRVPGKVGRPKQLPSANNPQHARM